jgi:hypothetical protein
MSLTSEQTQFSGNFVAESSLLDSNISNTKFDTCGMKQEATFYEIKSPAIKIHQKIVLWFLLLIRYCDMYQQQ